MRFHRLTISGFGPFAGTETIDFERLSAAGLFLLAGPTGAGKTTLLDSICYALFGETTAEGQGKGAVDGRSGAELRSARARPDQVTEVSLEFVVGGQRYRVARNPMYPREKRGGGTTTEQAAAALHRWHADPGGGPGQWEPIATKVREVTDRVEAITGFTADHFRRVVVIPQGRFRDVLISTADAREDLLKRIFGTHVYEHFEEVVAERHRDAAQRLATVAADRARILADHPWATGLDDAAVAVRIGEDVALARDAATAAGRALVAIETRHEAAARELGAATEVHKLVTAVAEAERRVAAATLAVEAIRPDREELARARAAAEPARLERLAGELAADARGAAADHAALVAERAAAEARVATERERAAAAVREHAATEAIDQRLGVIADLLAAADTLRVRHAEAARAVTAAAATVALATRAAEGAQHDVARADEEHRRAEQAWHDARQRHEADAAARLAATLAADTPCPVCGSRDHPRPARPTDGAPADAVVERLEKAMKAAAAARQALAEAFAARVAARGEAEGKEAGARAVAKALPPPVAVESLVEERDRLQATRARLEQARAATAAAVTQAEGALVRVAEKLAAAQARSHEFSARAEEAACAFTAGLAASPFATPEALAAAFREPRRITALEERIGRIDEEATTARAVLADRQRQLGGRSAPDPAALQAAYDALVAERQRAVAADEEARQRLAARDRLAADHAALAARAAQVGADAETAHALHRMVTGTAHAQERLSLHRWVLGAVLEEVVAQATVLLRQMTRGRYELVRAEATTRTTLSGLDIDVFDHWTGSRRGARTLSGGETFLASLALSLALARTAEAHQGGRRLETVFIDEGFGSLDAESLEYAMVALQGLRAEGRVVGVISHVEEMQRAIPVQLRLVRRGEVTTTEIVGLP
jgi:exonuclease SbcC